MRCFVALDLAPDVLDALVRVQRTLAREAPRADVRWVDPAALHLTLKFLGEVRDGELGGVAEALRAEVATHAPIALVASGLGGFPSLRRARVLWAGITDGLAPLGRLAAGLERALVPVGFAPEARPFRGHVTIARVRSPRGLGRLAEAVEQMPAPSFGAWTASEVVVYRSRLRPTGAVYEPLARLPLAGELPEIR